MKPVADPGHGCLLTRLRPCSTRLKRTTQREWGVVLYGANATLRADRRFRLSYKNTAFNDARLSFLQFRLNKCLEQELASSLGSETIGGRCAGGDVAARRFGGQGDWGLVLAHCRRLLA